MYIDLYIYIYTIGVSCILHLMIYVSSMSLYRTSTQLTITKTIYVCSHHFRFICLWPIFDYIYLYRSNCPCILAMRRVQLWIIPTSVLNLLFSVIVCLLRMAMMQSVLLNRLRKYLIRNSNLYPFQNNILIFILIVSTM